MNYVNVQVLNRNDLGSFQYVHGVVAHQMYIIGFEDCGICEDSWDFEFYFDGPENEEPSLTEIASWLDIYGFEVKVEKYKVE